MQRSRLDLHVHTAVSDGVYTPSEVVRLALERGLSVLGITDHDTVRGLSEAETAAAGTGLEIVPGVEVNSEGPWGDLHILGYYIDPADARLNERLEIVRDDRLGRARGIVERLSYLGLPLEWGEVAALAGGESVGRPHIARALLQRGYVESVQEAFDRYIASDGPAYVDRKRLNPAEAIDLIHAAGGVVVLAHPAQSGVIDLIPGLVSMGLQGLEIYYPRHSQRELNELHAIRRRYGLLATGGSDFHGPGHREGADLGAVWVPPECVVELRAQARGVADRRRSTPRE